jgi:hypothetical protein
LFAAKLTVNVMALIVAPDECSNRAARRWQHPLVGLVGMLNRDPAMRAVTL